MDHLPVPADRIPRFPMVAEQLETVKFAQHFAAARRRLSLTAIPISSSKSSKNIGSELIKIFETIWPTDLKYSAFPERRSIFMEELKQLTIQVSNPFLLPLMTQRYFATISHMNKTFPSFILDIGCSECSFLSYLSKRPDYLQFAVGVDKNPAVLNRGHQLLSAPSMRFQKSRPFPISLFCEDVTNLTREFIVQFRFAPFVTMLELIEHLTPHELDAAAVGVFGSLEPLEVFITTPNIEYNAVLTEAFSDKQRNGTFRHHDHKFEWNRTEFRDWCENISSRFGYSFIISGVGTVTKEVTEVGYASQTVLFSKTNRTVRPFVAPTNTKLIAIIEVDERRKSSSESTERLTTEESDGEEES
jgi:hypothetical protein